VSNNLITKVISNKLFISTVDVDKKHQEMIREIVPFFFALRTFIIKGTFLTFLIFGLVWISFAIYGSFYYAYLVSSSAYLYHLPVNFQFDPCPIESDKERCSFLKATVEIPQDDHSNHQKNDLTLGHSYSISLDLDLPSDDMNKKAGMFIICLKLENADGVESSQTTCHSSVLPHRSSVSRTLRSLLPFYNYGGEEFLSVEFVENFPAAKAHLEIKSRYLGISKASLRLHAHFKGLRYLMYHYPMTCGIVGVTFVLIFLISLVFLILGKMIDPVIVSSFERTSAPSTHTPPSAESKRRLERCPNFGKLVDKVEKSKEGHLDDVSSEEELLRKRQCNLHED